jgi:hypothetical protein
MLGQKSSFALWLKTGMPPVYKAAKPFTYRELDYGGEGGIRIYAP